MVVLACPGGGVEDGGDVDDWETQLERDGELPCLGGGCRTCVVPHDSARI